jgi:predicted Abi (CAAX) family protease
MEHLLLTVLGAVCTTAYRRTGSLWPPVLLHWVTVVCWMMLLGGRNRWSPLVQGDDSGPLLGTGGIHA